MAVRTVTNRQKKNAGKAPVAATRKVPSASKLTESAPEETAQARERILAAAEEAFAHKGYEGARVDEIAEAAGVNKALIYYYFKSKKALLEELFERLLDLLTAQKEDVYASLGPDDAGFLEAMIGRLTATMKERMNIFTVLFMEALKEDNPDPALFRVIDRQLKTSGAQMERHGFRAGDVEEWRVPALFFGAIPLGFFLLLKDKWVAHYKVDEKKLEEQFFRHLSSTYASWGVALLKERK